MKVGTDAVLLGVTVKVENAGNILEIGTGCGVIALILAQRCQARIDAIEIDKESVSQAQENAKNSPWKDRINVIHTSLQDFKRYPARKYKLVISNPPYFSLSLKSFREKRNISRHDDSLSFDELIAGSFRLMAPGASLWVILPVKESREFIDKAVNAGFFVHFILKIATKKDSEFQRVVLQFKKVNQENIIEQTLAIKNADGSFTREYMEVTKEFYIDF